MKINTVAVQKILISEENVGQRVDNFLRTQLKGVPKSMIYRIIRKGEIRVNKKRIHPDYKLALHDELRIPPIRTAEKNDNTSNEAYCSLNKVNYLLQTIIYEDNEILLLNKPTNIAVHGGSGLSFGVIEAFRSLRPEAKFLELVHRLDRETSGILMLAKKRSALKNLHEQMREHKIKKEYFALVHGQWPVTCNVVSAPLKKNILRSGERIVCVDKEGKPAETRFKLEKQFAQCSLIRAYPMTGRTHQIRVHTCCSGHPILFDSRYGKSEFDNQLRFTGLKRLFLHAYSLSFLHPKSGEKMKFNAELDEQLTHCLAILNENHEEDV